MKRRAQFGSSILATFVPLLFTVLQTASAQDRALNDQEKLGERLVNQSCVVCHLKQQITSGTYAPVLSKASLNGNAGVISEAISNGTPRMPGFKIQFAPAQIEAIVAYIKSIPAPSAAPRPGKAGGAGEPD
jgi:mono/diheme cytochrome c family protein